MFPLRKTVFPIFTRGLQNCGNIETMSLIDLLYMLCIMPRESHQNESDRSHRLVAFYLRSSRNIALTKIHFKNFLGLYSLEKEHKIAKINLGLSHRPCFDTARFQVLSANEALCIACIRLSFCTFETFYFYFVFKFTSYSLQLNMSID